MRYHNITKDDMLNGEGLRVVLWVSGCNHGCVGCHNKMTWDANDGVVFDEDAKKELFDELSKDYISGITFSGGDPLHPANILEITELAKEIKDKFPTKSIWLYTGSKWEEIQDLEVVNYVDIVVDGEFIESRKDASLFWKGSDNQKVIDVKHTLALGEIVLYA